MPIDDAQDHPEDSAKEEIIRALLRSAPTAHHSPIDIDLLVRVACGIGSPKEEMDLIREASRSAEVRHRFTAVRRKLLRWRKSRRNRSLRKPKRTRKSLPHSN